MKKACGLMLALLLCAVFAAGCSSDSSQSGSGSAASVENYLEWNKEDWDAASQADKTEVAEKMIVTIGETMIDNYGELVEEAKNNEATKSEFDNQLNEMTDEISAYFDHYPDGTLQDLVNSSSDVVSQALAQ